MSRKKIIGVIVGAVIVGVGAYFLFFRKNKEGLTGLQQLQRGEIKFFDPLTGEARTQSEQEEIQVQEAEKAVESVTGGSPSVADFFASGGINIFQPTTKDDPDRFLVNPQGGILDTSAQQSITEQEAVKRSSRSSSPSFESYTGGLSPSDTSKVSRLKPVSDPSVSRNTSTVISEKKVSPAEPTTSNLSSGFDRVKDRLIEAKEDVRDKVEDKVADVKEDVKEAVDDVKDFFKRWF